ncbi:MAG: hypothetical protein DRP09_12655 [Candidatus Thorarchaeota archaeon]|nr:MAG: hypothetical protein DRP09_12655 [Candidatus Thorarchaeota archaeon]
MRYVLSVDLGSEQDYTALSILERVEKIQEKNIPNHHAFKDEPVTIMSELNLTWLERVPLKTPYPAVVDRVFSIVNRPEFVNNIALIVDRTGVGLPVMQLMYTRGLAPIGISIHGGERVSASKNYYGVPKRDLVQALLQAFQMKRLKLPPPREMPIIKEFAKELSGFKATFNKNTGHDSYEAWLERIHDDLVLSVAMGVWWADKTHGTSTTRIMK